MPQDKALPTASQKLDFSEGRDLSHLGPDDKVMDEDHRIKAKFSTRFLAYLIDGVIFQIGVSLVLAMLGVSAQVAKTSPAVAVINLGMVLLVYCVPLYSSGQTLGKKIMKIQVVPAHGAGTPSGDLTMGQVLGREFLGKIISGLIFLLGFLWAIWDKDKQTWHDKMMKTYVVMVEGHS